MPPASPMAFAVSGERRRPRGRPPPLRAPSRAKASALARPMPLAAPVTIATLPSSLPIRLSSPCDHSSRPSALSPRQKSPKFALDQAIRRGSLHPGVQAAAARMCPLILQWGLARVDAFGLYEASAGHQTEPPRKGEDRLRWTTKARFEAAIADLKREDRYRIFANLERDAAAFRSRSGARRARRTRRAKSPSGARTTISAWAAMTP